MEDELIGKVWQNFGLLHENCMGANLFLHEKVCGGAAESGKRISKILSVYYIGDTYYNFLNQ